MRALAILSLCGLAATLATASAQASRIGNVLPPPVDAGPAARRTADPEPDTTAPWRYYPLEIGNVWEYGAAGGYLDRTRVVADTVALGNRYFVLEHESSPAPGDVFVPPPVRFDTASATLRELTSASTEVASTPDCPFDAAFGVTVTCEVSGEVRVEGTYDGVLVLGGAEAGTGEDTVRTAVKAFENRNGFSGGYAADIGPIYSGGEGTSRALRYARIGGVEYGSPRFPTTPEPADPEAATFDLRIWPNPARETITVALTVGKTTDVRAVVYDRLGREVAVLYDGPASGPLTLRLDAVPLPAGVYAVRKGHRG